MNEERICRRCLLIQSGRGDVLEDIRKRIERLPDKERTESAEYEERLGICSGCDSLLDGTCLKCGCYPEFRAAFAKNKCPDCKW